MRTSKYAVAGEPVAQFINRGKGSVGCWKCETKYKSKQLCHQIGSRVSKEKLKAVYKISHTLESLPGGEHYVTYTVVVSLH